MNTNIINKVLGASLLMITSMFAIPQGPCGPCGTCEPPKEVCCEKPAPGPFAFSYPRDIGLACPEDFFVFGEFLYLQANQEGLEYAISDSPCDPFGDSEAFRFPVTNGQVEGFCNDQHSWHWNPGFRVGFGFYMNHDAWVLGATWTNLNITDSTHVHLAGNGRLIPLWMTGDPIVSYGQPRASARWKADFNTLDLNLAKPYHISRYLVFSPHFGVRFAYIDQHYKAQYSAEWNGVDGASYIGDNDFWGLGTRVGFDSDWTMGCGAGLYANASASILYGKFEVDQTFRGGDGTDYYGEDNSMNSDIHTECYKNVTNFEIQAGIFWGMFFCDMRYHITMKFGWEFHVWHDQNQMRRWTDRVNPIYNDTISRGDLTFNGISFRLQLDL